MEAAGGRTCFATAGNLGIRFESSRQFSFDEFARIENFPAGKLQFDHLGGRVQATRRVILK